jgi:hypothetical protein
MDLGKLKGSKIHRSEELSDGAIKYFESLEIRSKFRPSIVEDVCPQINMFKNSVFGSYGVCWSGISRSPKCRSVEAQIVTWHDDITWGDVDLL